MWIASGSCPRCHGTARGMRVAGPVKPSFDHRGTLQLGACKFGDRQIGARVREREESLDNCGNLVKHARTSAVLGKRISS
jgi:hypothetical protein